MRLHFLSMAFFAAWAACAGDGFYRFERDSDGRWWAVDPSGERTVIRGVNWVVYRGHPCEADGASHYRDWNDAHYASRAEWEAETLARLKRWGFNALGASSDETLRHHGLAFARDINFSNTFGTYDDANDEHWILPHRRCPGSALPNVFHPDFPAHCARIAREICAPLKDDRELVGYYTDNELCWWAFDGWDPTGHLPGVFDTVEKLPSAHSARVALERFRAEHPDLKGDALKGAFLELVAERYFAITARAIREADPNHLNLGCRFAGLEGAHEIVWKVAGRHCDAVSFNCYPTADLAHNEMLFIGENLAARFRARHETVGKPLFVTEWSFPAMDSGLPCTKGAGQRFLTQKERAAATELFAKTLLALPFVIGYDYFMWVDEPANGISKAFPENSNYGLVNERGEPYPEVTAVFERLHAEVDKWRAAALPAVREGAAEYASWKPNVRWRGVNLLALFRAPWNRSDSRARGAFREEEFKWISDWGFNFARLPMDYRNFTVSNDWSRVREEGFRRVDEAVAFGAKYGIHVQLCLHRAPGYVIFDGGDKEPASLKTDAGAQKAFCDLWRAFARRYRGIPNERLSFNPVNEPDGFSEAQYARVFAAVLIAIREEDPNRFVMLDGRWCASKPVPLFRDFRSTGQAFRGYTPHAITHYGMSYIPDQPVREPGWPIEQDIIDKRWIFEMPRTTMDKYVGHAQQGYPVMIGEFGCANKVKHETALRWMEDCLKMWKENNLSWAIWNLDGPFGFLDSGRPDVDYEDFEGHKLDRKMLELLMRY